MDVTPLGPGFAAELRGVTLADVASDDAAYAATRAAFEQHSVLVLRNQEVTDEIQLAFSRRFGPPEVTKVGSEGTGSHFVILSTIGPDGKVVPADHRMAMRAKANQLWHTDSSFKRVPALTSILSARIIPAQGGETEFASTRLAFERLDADMRSQLQYSFAWHRASQAQRNARCCRRNAGAWCGPIPSMVAARSISLPMPSRSRAWKQRRGKS
jgi:alpha-ketoglutarate-dependent 2,4-dichlorophenoxyacetate dioxygenase